MAIVLEKERQEVHKDERLSSPFSGVDTGIERNIPRVMGITDTHYQRNMSKRMGADGISNGKGNTMGLGFIPYFRNKYREIVQTTNVALHAMRSAMETALKDADLIIHGGDVSDSLTLHGIVGDLAFQEEMLGTRLERSHARGQKEGFLGTIVMNGNHDAGFNILHPDFLIRYPDIWMRFRQIPIALYEKVVDAIESGTSMQELARKLHIKDRESVKFAMHPALKWFLERTYFGPAIGIFRDSEHNSQVAFLDSELETKESSVQALENSLIRDLSLHTQNPELLARIVGLRQKEHVQQNEIIEHLLTSADTVKTVIYAHNPHSLQRVLIEHAIGVLGMDKEAAQTFVETRLKIIGGHWHTNDDQSAEKWNKPNVIWWNGPSRLKMMLSMYSPVGSEQKAKRGVLAEDDYVSVLAGALDAPQTLKVTAETINKERARLRRVVATMPLLKDNAELRSLYDLVENTEN